MSRTTLVYLPTRIMISQNEQKRKEYGSRRDTNEDYYEITPGVHCCVRLQLVPFLQTNRGDGGLSDCSSKSN